MVPKPHSSRTHYSSIGVKPIANREALLKSTEQWIEDKKANDGAEGLWRIHDDLYDLSDFLDTHPGGRFWLEETKGNDITEAFEAHHVRSTKPEEMLRKFHVRRAKISRSSPYTFAENGFYKTLKRRAREALKRVPENVRWKSNFVIDLFLTSSFVLSTLACHYWSYSLGIFAGLILGWAAVAAHNYCHQRDSFRMYYGDLSFVPVREIRISHVLSHHMFTNTIADMQTYSLEPFLRPYPHAKSLLVKYGSWLYGPLIMFPLIFHALLLFRVASWIFQGRGKYFGKSDLLPVVLPCTMYCFSGQPLLPTLGMWLVVLGAHNLWYSSMGGASTHFHPDIFMDGDKSRPPEEMDWGIAQLDAVSDRIECTKVHWLGLITFGDHAMHHLFPSVDHAVLNYLYPVVEKTMEDFNLTMRITSQADMIGGFFRQLARETPNPNPPNLFVNRVFKEN